MHVAAKALGNPYLLRAAEAYERAARAPYGRIPRPTRAGDGLRTTARLMAMTSLIGDETTVNVLVLAASLITLMDAVADLHTAQQRDAQAAAVTATPPPDRQAHTSGWPSQT